MTRPNPANNSIFTMSTAELRSRADKAKSLYAQIADLLPGLITLTEADRRHSEGKLRDGESDALDAVINVAEAHPAYFASLADKDGGVDPDSFETGFLRDHLERRRILAEIAAAGEHLSTPLGDTMLDLGQRVRPVLLAAYHLAKSIAVSDGNVRTRLAPALDFYGKIARRAAETRLSRKPPDVPK